MTGRPITKVLIANRGEIACRIIRACRSLGLATVAVHSEADERSLHVELADEAVAIGPAKPKESYLDIAKVLGAARMTGADAVHPGYGFLAENEHFCEAVQAAALVWVGPSVQSIRDMGDKERARRLAHEAGVPVVPGSARFEPGELDGLEEAAAAVGFPLLVKASAGGGGIGMRKVLEPGRLRAEVEATQNLAQKSFGDGTVYLERYVWPARHVEIQVFGFGDGHAIHLLERDCSIQRRFQKIVEESRAPGIPAEVLARMAEDAARLAARERYRGAGTVEFIVGPAHDYYFLEMNTRIQVEHPVTEMLTGIDLVEAQLRLARGEHLQDRFRQETVRPCGHAIEARVYAERPAMGFLPSPGTITAMELPAAEPGLRIDTGYRAGDQVTIHYDPMLAKIIVGGADRAQAIDRLDRALAATRIEGIGTNIAFLRKLLAHERFRAGEVSTGFVDEHIAELRA